MMSPFASLYLALALISAPTAASASPPRHADGAAGVVTVTLNVPVQVTSLDPRFTKLHVGCLLTAPGTTPLATSPNATADVSITNGVVNGTIPVSATITVQSSGETWSYQCQFSLYDSTLNKWWSDVPPSTVGGNSSIGGSLGALIKPGTQSQLRQVGTFTIQ
jgi:hypothetical protein